ncbi:hypothetical protein HMPREF9123_1674 [Neisseria bacilliformis ATCC BAA-1200]|uniref:Uncharacterized protein n=1 Tax=Neisseria bacilliformis ATCC BAA-1200 TaxID=888742 RepID=F2BD68_9NEIS|nr:hypothetical protein HMPREF9123_1674 [Neisseria bacilliformis ATCC BAA-1200]
MCRRHARGWRNQAACGTSKVAKLKRQRSRSGIYARQDTGIGKTSGINARPTWVSDYPDDKGSLKAKGRLKNKFSDGLTARMVQTVCGSGKIRAFFLSRSQDAAMAPHRTAPHRTAPHRTAPQLYSILSK